MKTASLKTLILAISFFFCPGLLLHAFGLSSGSLSDDKLVSLRLADAPLRQALEMLSEQTQVDFVFPDELVRGITVTCTFEEISLDLALEQVLLETELSFRMVSERQIVIANRDQQRKVTIRGKVVDRTNGRSLSDVNVFIANSMMGDATNKRGEFSFSVPTEVLSLWSQGLGMPLVNTPIRVASPNEQVYTFRLRPKPYQAPEIVVSAADREKWRKNLKKFTKLFFSTTQNAAKCTILNPFVLEFYKKKGGVFKATAHEPLSIINKALGYKLYYYLEHFEDTPDYVSASGIPRFEELVPKSAEELAKWEQNRFSAYQGSLRHFLATICKNYDKPIKDVKTLAKIDVINKKNLLRTTRTKTISAVQTVGDKFVRKEMARVLQEGFNVFLIEENPFRFDKPSVEAKLVNTNWFLKLGRLPNERWLSFPHFLHITFTKEMEENNYLGYLYEARAPKEQTSLITLKADSLLIDTSGRIYNRFGLMTYEYWAWEALAEMLPYEYSDRVSGLSELRNVRRQ